MLSVVMRRVSPPIGWYGGKKYLLKEILKMIPSHRTYVEVFGGAAHLLFAKEPSPIEIYNDIDGDLVNLYRVLRDPEKFIQFFQKVGLTLYSRQMWEEAALDVGDEVSRAVNCYIRIRQSFSAKRKGWAFSRSSRSKDSYSNKFFLLPFVHLRLRYVQIENDDFVKIIERYDSSDTFFYVDPPYVLSTLRSEHSYESLEDWRHEELVDLLLKVRGKVLLSGYENPIYRRLETEGWFYRDVVRPLMANFVPKPDGSVGVVHQTERLWWNYSLESDNKEGV